MVRIEDHVEITSLGLPAGSYHLESFKAYLASLLSTANQRVAIFYGNAIQFIDNLQIPGRLTHSLNLITTTGEDVVNIFKNSTRVHIHLHPYFSTFKTFLRNEVSKQAIYFGCAGLVTGGMIGLCIGYTVKRNSFSSQYFASPVNGTSTLMKAILCSSSRRGIDGITLATIAVPSQMGSKEVLIQVKAVGLDNIDVRIATGYGHLLRKNMCYPAVTEPFVLGRECAGIVLEVGSLVTAFEINDRVWVCLPLSSSVGCCSEYIVVSERYIGHKPRNINFEAAATMPYSFTMWHQILSKSSITPYTARGKRVLIHLGPINKNDGVGLLATQILKSWGARVTITTGETIRPQNVMDEEVNSVGVAQMTFLHSLKSLGAENHIIIPNDAELLPNLSQRIYDVVVNTDSPAITPFLIQFLRDTNEDVIETFPSVVPRRSPWSILKAFDCALNLFYRPRNESCSCDSILEEGRRLVEAGFVSPVVSRSFLTSQYDQAFRHVCNTSSSALAHVGKSVLLFKPTASAF